MHAKTYEAWGEVKTAKEWEADPRCKVDARTLYNRVASGTPVEEALSKPKKDIPDETLVEAFGESKSISAWAKDPRCAVSLNSLAGRLSRGWEAGKALSTPMKVPRKFEAFGETKTLSAWGKDSRCVVSLPVLKARIKRGWQLNEALTQTKQPVFIGKQYEAFGESKTLTEWHTDDRTQSMDISTLHLRLKSRQAEEALTMALPAPSSGELQLCEYVCSKGVEVQRNVRGIISPLELDIYVPDKRAAIEFNGIYWHAEPFKDKWYHYNKAKASMSAGIRLVQVWEDDWLRKPELVKEMVAVKLGVSELPKVGARQCSVVEVSAQDTREFLDCRHIQGATNGSVRLGLVCHNQLVAVMVFRARPDGTWELARYASSALVRGGFQKLVKAFRQERPNTILVSFAALDVSDGSLYETAGWHKAADLPPDYMYVYGGRRVHKFNFRKKRFKTDPLLQFDPDVTERELAALNNIPRIWDAGKVKYVLEP